MNGINILVILNYMTEKVYIEKKYVKKDNYYTANRNEFDWLTLPIELIKVETDKIKFLAVI